MIVETVMGRVALTDHAVERYRERVNPQASVSDVAQALKSAPFMRRTAMPAWVLTKTALHTAENSPGAFVTVGFAFPVRAREAGEGPRVDFVAPTCLLKPRRSKAEVRAWRERRAEEWAA